MQKTHFLACALAVMCTSESMAFDWGATRLVYLRGDGYESPKATRFEKGKVIVDEAEKNEADIVTFEHVNGTKWGDTFFFLDATNASTLRDDPYFEFNPRISSKKTLGMNYGSIVDDILITTQYNAGKNASPVYLYGFAVDWKVPAFDFVQTHFYLRDDRNKEGTSSQLTVVWSSKFQAGLNLEFSGFLDYAMEEGKEETGVSVANLLTQPAIYALISDDFALGIEYQYWSNKYGLENLQDSVPQLAIRLNL
jgi:nucleoside-specific outer membrane channel protein Tsx